MLDVRAMHAYDACMKNRRSIQYTIRDVPERVDARLREVASEYGTSLNKAALSVLARGLGEDPDTVVYHDLDNLLGSWVQDQAFDEALAEMDRVDSELWS